MRNQPIKPFIWLIIMLCSAALIGLFFTPAVADEINDGQGISEMEQDEGVPTSIDDGGADAVYDGSFGRNNQATWIGAMAFTPYDSSTAWVYATPGMRAITGGSPWMDQVVRLQSGARLILVRMFYDDNSAAGRVWFWLWRNRYEGVSPFTFTQIATASSPVGISRYSSVFVNTNETIRNQQNYYHIRFRSDNASARFAAIRLFWHRQIRSGLPNPFNDIGFLPAEFRNSITALADSGITTGTTATTYSPSAPVTRAQMAVFLARAMGLYWEFFDGF
jgi:hypothetical protein